MGWATGWHNPGSGRGARAVIGGRPRFPTCADICAIGVAGLVALGVDFHEAKTALLLLAFLVFLPLFLWAFAAASLARVWAALGGGAVFMTAAA